ncbi:MAG: hypothetical protein NXI10_03600 [bacterium]|nr:hypothetical protein [bacterium]
MEAIYTNQQVREYLTAQYVGSYRRNQHDHFYNHRNRQTMAVPLPEDKPFFTEHDVVQVFGGKAQHDDYIEIVRFQQFTQHQNQHI